MVPFGFAIAAVAIACSPPAGPPAEGHGSAALDAHLSHVVPFTLRGRGEALDDLTYAYDHEGSPLPRAIVEDILRRAIRIWEDAGAVKFRPAGVENPRLTFAWRRGTHGQCPPFIGWCGTLAHAGPMGASSFIHFNADRSFRGGAAGVELLQVAVHEIGHVIGLDHSPNPRALMSPRYRTAGDHLTPPDLQGVHSLYGGGTDTPGDLLIWAGPGGRLEHAAPALRGIAPPEKTCVALFDFDRDGCDEILVWARPPAMDFGLMIYHFDRECRLVKTTGPAFGVVNPSHAVHFSHSEEQGIPFVVHVGEAGRYRAAFCSESGLPLEPWPRGVPLRLRNGMRDDNGDGVLDNRPTAADPARGLGKAVTWADWGDLDGDGESERVARRISEE